uniref:Uncharacterized protein n=1 Tax=Cyclopterus lumpus TaxID=8103 RepID=A0A8C2Z5V0_CYCLU
MLLLLGHSQPGYLFLHPVSEGFIPPAAHGPPLVRRFITKLGRTLCVSHPDDAKWVRRYIKHLDESRPRAR